MGSRAALALAVHSQAYLPSNHQPKRTTTTRNRTKGVCRCKVKRRALACSRASLPTRCRPPLSTPAHPPKERGPRW
jgi:hypothetical protein